MVTNLNIGALTLERVMDGEYKGLLPNVAAAIQQDMARFGDDSGFFDHVDEGFTTVVDLIQSTPRYRRFDCEDRTSIDIVNGLKLLNFEVHHEAYHNGNVDITVSRNEKTLLVEAKLDTSNTHISEGFRQLVDRYLTEYSSKKMKVKLLVYCKKKNATEALNSWKRYIQKSKNFKKEYRLSITDVSSPRMTTSHRSKVNGKMVEVEHIFVQLRDVASDKSARGRKSDTCPNCGSKAKSAS